VRARGRWQGVGQIVRFNWRFYVAAGAGVTAALAIALIDPHALPPVWRRALLAGSLAAMFWTCASLAVAHYVYDCFPLYELDWLARCLARPPRRWVNIHAGLDETSDRIAARFPRAQGRVLDIYDPKEMTEASIEQARQLVNTPANASEPADWRALPLTDGSLDAVFLTFAAHELRRHEARTQLFREARRVLAGGGELVLVEHLRNWANFLAFGPGCLHFLPERAWRNAMDESGLNVAARFSLTPFVHVFVLRGAS
jgi:hypothetical protein